MVTGRVKFYDAEKGYGYLTQDSGGADVYVGKAALHAGVDGLARGKRVEFEVSQGRRAVLPELGQGRYQRSSSQRVAEMARTIVHNLDMAATASQRLDPARVSMHRGTTPGRRAGAVFA